MAEFNWRDHMPRGVIDPNGPDDEPMETPTDRRLLWHIEGALAVRATTDTLRDLGRAIRAYLNETCEHHWRDYEAEADIAAHRQCFWCSDVEWLDGDPADDGSQTDD